MTHELRYEQNTHETQEASPFPAGDHKAARNRKRQYDKEKHETQITKMHRLGTVNLFPFILVTLTKAVISVHNIIWYDSPAGVYFLHALRLGPLFFLASYITNESMCKGKLHLCI